MAVTGAAQCRSSAFFFAKCSLRVARQPARLQANEGASKPTSQPASQSVSHHVKDQHERHVRLIAFSLHTDAHYVRRHQPASHPPTHSNDNKVLSFCINCYGSSLLLQTLRVHSPQPVSPAKAAFTMTTTMFNRIARLFLFFWSSCVRQRISAK